MDLAVAPGLPLGLILSARGVVVGSTPAVGSAAGPSFCPIGGALVGSAPTAGLPLGLLFCTCRVLVGMAVVSGLPFDLLFCTRGVLVASAVAGALSCCPGSAIVGSAAAGLPLVLFFWSNGVLVGADPVRRLALGLLFCSGRARAG